MSKNLEMEYKKQIQNNVPDLWNRIEAGLEEKKPVNQRKRRKSVRRKNFYFIGGGILAAGLCVAVALPVFTRTTKNDCATDAALSVDMNAESVGECQDNEVAGNFAMNNAENDMMMEEAQISKGETEKSDILKISVKILEATQTEEGTEYQAQVLEEATGMIKKESLIRLLQEETEEPILELQKEYTMEIESADGQYYRIKSIEK